MATKTKTFDCVELKRKAQQQLRAEYERRKAEFETYFDFLDAKARESDWVQRMEHKLRPRE